MKRGSSRRNLSVGLLLLVLLFACVVSHKFREGMESKEVEKRLDNMEDKLDDIYEEVVGEGIKTGRYVYHEDDGEYDDDDHAETMTMTILLISVVILTKMIILTR